MANGPVTPASASLDEVHQSLAYALRHNGRRAFRQANAAMADITAAHLLKALRLSGYVVMRGPAPAAPSDAGHYDAAARAKKRRTD